MFFSAFTPFFSYSRLLSTLLVACLLHFWLQTHPLMQVKLLLQTLRSLGPDPSLSLTLSLDLYFSSSVVFCLLNSAYLVVHVPIVWYKNDLPVYVCPSGEVLLVFNTLNTSQQSFQILQLAHWRV